MVPERQLDENPPKSADEIPLEVVADFLSQPMRRGLLECLSQSDEPLAVADVAKEIVWRMDGKSRAEVTHEEAKKCHLSLQHRDIPKLAEYGLVTRDERDDTVALTELGDELVNNCWPL